MLARSITLAVLLLTNSACLNFESLYDGKQSTLVDLSVRPTVPMDIAGQLADLTAPKCIDISLSGPMTAYACEGPALVCQQLGPYQPCQDSSLIDVNFKCNKSPGFYLSAIWGYRATGGVTKCLQDQLPKPGYWAWIGCGNPLSADLAEDVDTVEPQCGGFIYSVAENGPLLDWTSPPANTDISKVSSSRSVNGVLCCKL